MTRTVRRAAARLGIVVASAAALTVLLPGTASAHPLGNFTVNRYSAVVVAPDVITVDHVRDLAEIPTAQQAPTIDTTGDGSFSRSELARYARAECHSVTEALRLEVDGTGVPLSVGGAVAHSAQGQAGLPVLRLECALEASVDLTSPVRVHLRDIGADRDVGWKEMTAEADGVTLTRSDVPRRSRSGRLTSYPKDLLSSPLDVTAARLTVRPGGERLMPVSATDDVASVVARSGDQLTGAFEGLAARAGGSPVIAVVALGAAILLGAAHAVAPGHGKTVMAFYLSGRRDRAVGAATTVGLTITATHTAGVLLIGLAVSAGTAFAPARLYPWLSLVSGLLVVAVGVTLLRTSRGRHEHAHGHGHAHAHGHAQPHGGGHALVPAEHHAGGVATLDAPAEVDHRHDHEHLGDHGRPGAASRRGLVAMGLAGGLVPSPSALVVFLGASGLGHPWLGVALVVAFGTGMAATLAAVGLLVMRLRDRAQRRLMTRPNPRVAQLLRLAPLVTASAVVLLGCGVALRGLASAGLL